MGNAFELARLSLGAFLTSPGAGILGLIGAGYLTYLGVDKRLKAERRMAREARQEEFDKEIEADARERWQASFEFLWGNRNELGGQALLGGIEALRQLGTTKQQSAMLEVLTMAVISQAEDEL